MLKLPRIAVGTYRENIAYLSRHYPLYRAEKFQGLDKTEIDGFGRSVLPVPNVADDSGLLAQAAFKTFVHDIAAT